MKFQTIVQMKWLKELLTILCAFLFIYAATSKLLDFENFRAQIGQSPVLSAYADILALVVPIVELIIAAMLITKKLRLVGLLAFYILMVAFTAYIIVIMNFSDFIPCSCGGILEKMGWGEHLVFNIIFCLIAFFLVMTLEVENTIKKLRTH
ncbi:MAG: hypothetical protein KDC69_10360 [Flavobacteriaceae bacterium]|nr:hypothetical protein [Flavobacteriaceae bacterium]